MRCADPVLCYLDSKGNRKFRNFSFAKKSIHGIPLDHIVFDCGKCLPCRKKRATELAIRCVLHASLYPRNCFLTLTYDEKREGYHNEFNYSDIQKFKKRFRQNIWRTEKKRVEVFNVHEYGKNGKKHWHLILFNHDFRDKTLHSSSKGIPLYTSKILEQIWGHGFVTIGDVSLASAMYQAKYMEKDFSNGNVKSRKQSHSKHSGIGGPYFKKHFKQLLSLGFLPFNGKKIPLPRYFEKIAHKHYCHYFEPDKFFDTQQRKALFRPFKNDEPNEEVANLYKHYLEQKESKIQELSLEWDEIIKNFLTSGQEPDFVKSSSNQLYDLKNKQIGVL